MFEYDWGEIPMDMEKKTIVVLEDQEDIIALYEFYLDKYKVIPFKNAHQLIKKLSSLSADLYIVDLSLPDMDGIDFIRKLQDAHLGKVPIVIVSGVVDMEYCAKACDLHVNDIISKPFDRDQINDIVTFKLSD